VTIVVVAVRVIKIIRGITIAWVVWIRLPVGGRLVRLGSWRSGGSAVTVQEVASAEDTNRELPASGVDAGGITGEGSKEYNLGIKGGKVNEDVSVKDWEDHRDVAYGSARVATVEISKALQVRRVRAGHDEARGGKEITSKAVEVRSEHLGAKDASTSGRGYSISKHCWEEMVRKAEEGAAVAKDAVFANAISMECISSLSELRVDVVGAVPLDVGRLINFRRESVVLEVEADGVNFESFKA
jgi:hypothetical protein